MTTNLDPLPGEELAAKFEAAWLVFGQTCSHFVAPEATYQVWFAHYLISQFGIDRPDARTSTGARGKSCPNAKKTPAPADPKVGGGQVSCGEGG